MSNKTETVFAVLVAILAAACLSLDVWAFSMGLKGMPLWIWLVSVVCASLALVGAFLWIVVGIAAPPNTSALPVMTGPSGRRVR
jgi:hypothetical protein